MYADCLAARRTLDVEQFILKYEPLTARFFELFMAKARAGVAVRILCDMVGSYNIYESALVHDLRDAGVQVRFVNPISAWRVTNFTAWFFRDHRKLVLVDLSLIHI